MMRDSRIESLMVIGYNPSHSNINSEVNAPFKILSTLLRFIDTEARGEGPSKTSLAHRQADYDDEEDIEEEAAKKQSNLQNYTMQRCRDLYGGGQGERLDTVEGPYDLYDQEQDEEDEDQADNNRDFDQMNDDESDEDLGGMHDNSDSEEEDLDANLGLDLPPPKKAATKEKPKRKESHDKIEVNFDDIPDDDDQECLLDY